MEDTCRGWIACGLRVGLGHSHRHASRVSRRASGGWWIVSRPRVLDRLELWLWVATVCLGRASPEISHFSATMYICIYIFLLFFAHYKRNTIHLTLLEKERKA